MCTGGQWCQHEASGEHDDGHHDDYSGRGPHTHTEGRPRTEAAAGGAWPWSHGCSDVQHEGMPCHVYVAVFRGVTVHVSIAVFV